MSRLTKSKVIHAVGKELFELASQEVKNTTGDFDDSVSKVRKVAVKICSYLEESQIPNSRALRLLMSFFEDLPVYSLASNIATRFHEYSVEERQLFWRWVRKLLESGTPLQKNALGYSLWVDFFENPQTIDEAWQSLTTPLPQKGALQTILIYSGPVTWEKKWSLFLDVYSQPDMHYYIFRSILHSQFDMYGKIDAREALQVLSKLKLPPETEHFAKLRKKLQEDVLLT